MKNKILNVVTKEIFAPLDGDITMWHEIDEQIETL